MTNIVPTIDASRETKNRLQGKANLKIVERGHPSCYDGKECILVQSDGELVGWVPLSEVIVDDGVL